MGGCSSRETEEPIVVKKWDFNESHTKQFEKGEVYYMLNRDNTNLLTVVDASGGRNKIQIFLSLKSKNKNKSDNLKYIKIDLSISAPNDESKFSLLDSTYAIETENNSSNITLFNTNFYMDFFFEKHQHLKFEIFHKEILCETIQTTLGKIIGSRNNFVEFNVPLSQIPDTPEVSLVINAVPIKEDLKNSIVRLEIVTDLSGMPYSDYFVVVSNTLNQGLEQKIWKSDEQTGKEFCFVSNNLYLYDICQGDMEKYIIIDFYRVFYGHVSRIEISMNKIGDMMKEENIPLENVRNGKKIGFCKMNYNFQSSLRFLDYIENGLQMSLAVGIDFTSSNGKSDEDNSLHYIYGSEPNFYEMAIRSCGSIVAHYDFGQLFSIYGFGAVIGTNPNTNHCFNLNFRDNPTVEGIEGIIGTYKKGLKKIQLDGPTYFSPLIRNTVDYIKFQTLRASSSVYYVLLILTDGQIHDMQQTKDIIVEAAVLPVSIIIIGIGSDDFTNMIELDGDTVPIKNKKGVQVDRDIVQFVRFNDFKTNSVKLSEEVLREVPLQVEQYYRKYLNFRGMP